jgi:hypothetical protein
MKTFFFSWNRKIPFLGLEDFFPGLEDFCPAIGRFLSLYWKDSFLGLEDSFARNGRFLPTDWTIPFPLADSFPGRGRFHVAEKEFHSLPEAGEVSHSSIIFQGPSCQISCKYFFFYWLSHFYLMKKPPKGSQAVISTLFGRPQTVLRTQKCMVCTIFWKNIMRRLEAFWSSSLEIYTPLENSR